MRRPGAAHPFLPSVPALCSRLRARAAV